MCAPLPAGELHPACYFYAMHACLVRGWAPVIRDVHQLRPAYRASGNYPSFDQFPQALGKEFGDMIDNGVVTPADGFDAQDYRSQRPRIMHPMGAVVKSSDRVRASLLAGVPAIIDDDSLQLASDRLTGKVPLADGHTLLSLPKVKVRATTDATQPGINGAAYSPPFSYPSIHEAVKIVRRGGWLGKGDVGRYFFSFPFAYSVRHLFACTFLGVVYLFCRCFFGFTACPYYTSAFSAEIRRWVMHRGISCSHMVDDWLTAGDTEEEVRASMGCIAGILQACGFVMAEEKFDYGQRLVFLGILLDCTTMTMRFDAVQARAFRLELLHFRDLLSDGKPVPATMLRHLCGKLNWYAEVVQSGRLHTRPFWVYLHHGRLTSALWLGRLHSGMCWWLEQLQHWESDAGLGNEYPILSASELNAQPLRVVFVQGDYSGTDGFGFFHCTLGDYRAQRKAKHVSHAWPLGYVPPSSHYGELYTLETALADPEVAYRDCLLIWITDSLSAAHSVNRGSCRSEASFHSLSHSFYMLDSHHAQIFALWVPREENELADYLSHLAHSLGRDSVRGEIRVHRGAAA
jgi:hypothetical protein